MQGKSDSLRPAPLYALCAAAGELSDPGVAGKPSPPLCLRIWTALLSPRESMEAASNWLSVLISLWISPSVRVALSPSVWLSVFYIKLSIKELKQRSWKLWGWCRLWGVFCSGESFRIRWSWFKSHICHPLALSYWTVWLIPPFSHLQGGIIALLCTVSRGVSDSAFAKCLVQGNSNSSTWRLRPHCVPGADPGPGDAAVRKRDTVPARFAVYQRERQ